jgi:hypothetical protein
MKPYERRAAGIADRPYFKLATWDARNMTWRAGKRALTTEAEARSQAAPGGRYRIERFDEGGGAVLEPFTA